MRINVNVPDLRSASTSKVDLSTTPQPLVRLAPSNELVMIELQGSLEIDDPHPDGGQTLAELEFHPGREDKPTLLISHHRLEGKLVTLTKPFAVLEKKKRAESVVMQNVDVNKPSTIEGRSAAIAESEACSSPPPSMSAFEEDGAVSPSLRARKRARPTGETQQHLTAAATSSSPVRPRMLPGSEADFSSPMPVSKRARKPEDEKGIVAAIEHGEEEQCDADLTATDKEETSTYLEVVCIIRKKFLFSKRPEPIVRLDQAGGEKAKQALGLAESEAASQ